MSGSFPSTGVRFNFNKYSASQIDSLGTPYDYNSVMHYERTAFGYGRETIRPKQAGVGGQTQLCQCRLFRNWPQLPRVAPVVCVTCANYSGMNAESGRLPRVHHTKHTQSFLFSGNTRQQVWTLRHRYQGNESPVQMRRGRRRR